jgi:exosortase B
LNTALAPASYAWRSWWPLALGLSAVLLMSYVRFFNGAWNEPGGDHAPVIVAIALFLFWYQREALAQAQVPAKLWPGAVLLVAGLLVLMLGVRTRISSFEALGHIPLVAGALWIAGGANLLRRMWFPLFFLLLAVPIPTFLLGMATANLKEMVSYASVELLYRVGYPIARDGVVISIGHYRLLVAEACSGMNSIMSLSAVGLVFLYLTPLPRRWMLVAAICSILPIAIAANIIRIILLTLITYHLGDEAGQGFLHEFAGMAMFGFALVAFFSLTSLLARAGRAAPQQVSHA